MNGTKIIRKRTDDLDRFNAVLFFISAAQGQGWWRVARSPRDAHARTTDKSSLLIGSDVYPASPTLQPKFRRYFRTEYLRIVSLSSCPHI